MVNILGTAIRNVGVVRGARATGVVALWAIALADNDGEPLGRTLSESVRAYSEFWKQSERTSWRDLRLFRLGFPGETDPQRLAELLVKQKVVTADQDQRTATAAVSSVVFA